MCVSKEQYAEHISEVANHERRVSAVVERLRSSKDTSKQSSIFSWGRMTITIKDDTGKIVELWKPKRYDVVAVFSYIHLHWRELFAAEAQQGYEFVYEDITGLASSGSVRLTDLTVAEPVDFATTQRAVNAHWGVHKHRLCPVLRHMSLFTEGLYTGPQHDAATAAAPAAAAAAPMPSAVVRAGGVLIAPIAPQQHWMPLAGGNFSSAGATLLPPQQQHFSYHHTQPQQQQPQQQQQPYEGGVMRVSSLAQHRAAAPYARRRRPRTSNSMCSSAGSTASYASSPRATSPLAHAHVSHVACSVSSSAASSPPGAYAIPDLRVWEDAAAASDSSSTGGDSAHERDADSAAVAAWGERPTAAGKLRPAETDDAAKLLLLFAQS